MPLDHSSDKQRERAIKYWGDPVVRFWSRVVKTDNCWTHKNAKHKNGYVAIRWGGKQTLAHRVAFFLSNGWWPETVCHTCDNPSCVRPDHLFGGTQKDNIQDMHNKGRHRGGAKKGKQTGQNNNGSKITERQARRVLLLYELGLPQYDIAAKTGVKRANVWAIVNKKSWSHLKI